MHQTFQKWAEIDGLVIEKGEWAVVDRMALRDTKNQRNLHRWQVINTDQSIWKTYKNKGDAIRDCSMTQFGLKLVG